MWNKKGEIINRESIPPSDLSDLFPVEEIYVKSKRDSLISIHQIQTDISPHDIRSHPTIEKYLSDHNLGFCKHYWNVDEFDIVRPFYVLFQDPRFTLKEDIFDHLDASQAFLDELMATRVKAVPATITQTNSKNPIKTQIYALECQRKHKNKLLSLIQNHYADRNTTFLPAKFKYNNKKAWNNAIKAQRDHNRHTKCVSITNLNNDQVEVLRKELKKVHGVYGLYRRYKDI